MNNLTSSEQTQKSKEAELEAREKKLQQREADLSEREEEFGERAIDFSPTVRAIMTLAAQGLGFILLFVLGTGTFELTPQPDVVRGLQFIVNIGWKYLGLSLVICLIILLLAAYRKVFDNFSVDLMLLLFVGMDIVLLLLLVYQQGGLCRSMFLPVFFLIPTAYLIAERREKRYRWRRLLVLIIITACICSSYRVSVAFQPGAVGTLVKPAEGITPVFHWWSVSITDFCTLAHRDYDKAIFRASLISAFVPIIQILIVIFRVRIKGGGDNKTLPAS